MSQLISLQMEDVRSRAKTPVRVPAGGSVGDLAAALAEEIKERPQCIRIIIDATIQEMHRKLRDLVRADNQVVRYSVVRPRAIPVSKATESAVCEKEPAKQPARQLTDDEFCSLAE